MNSLFFIFTWLPQLLLQGTFDESHQLIINKDSLASEVDLPFLLAVEDVFSITERGTVITGKIESGKVSIGDTVVIIGFSNRIFTTEIMGIEKFRKQLQFAEKGENVGLFLKDISKDSLQRGMVLASPGTARPYKKFEADVYLLKKEEGGRHTPFYNNYRPRFSIRTADMLGVICLEENQTIVVPGDSAKVKVELEEHLALAPNLAFEIKEGGRVIGRGVVSKIDP